MDNVRVVGDRGEVSFDCLAKQPGAIVTPEAPDKSAGFGSE